MYPFYLGIDLHLKRTYTVLMDQTGKVIDKRRIRNFNMIEYLSLGFSIFTLFLGWFLRGRDEREKIHFLATEVPDCFEDGFLNTIQMAIISGA